VGSSDRRTGPCECGRHQRVATVAQPRTFRVRATTAILHHVPCRGPDAPASEELREKLWWCLCIRANRFRFHFGRQANRTIASLALPDGMPPWASQVEFPTHDSEPSIELETSIDVSSWDTYHITDLFGMQFGPHTSRLPLGKGSTPLVTASAWNNGISAQVAVEPHWLGGQITLPNNGSVGTAFYQPWPFTASRDVTVLEPKVPLSPASALFICTVLRRESARFNYARKWTGGRMKESTIRLPSTGGQPDFSAMEAFMLRLPLGWSLR
jgi:Type I restriction modification DNA specificity domain